MTRRGSVSAGLLLFRRSAGMLEVFLAHPGGPFWASRDAGAWTIPKGRVDEGEDLLDAARREFTEETSFTPPEPLIPLGAVRQKSGKIVHAWACEGDADPDKIISNVTQNEWPRGSGRRITFPEVDRCAWFDLTTARQKINPAQAELIERLKVLLAG